VLKSKPSAACPQEDVMPESRSNHPCQTGMAVLVIVVLFGALFLGAGGLIWVWIRAERAQRAAEVEAQYQEQVARDRAAAAMRMAEKPQDGEQEDREEVESKSAPSELVPDETNEPAPADDGEP
jgi:uncharacterized protein HemX